MIGPLKSCRRAATIALVACAALFTSRLMASDEITANETWFPKNVEATIVSDGLNTNGIRIKIWEIRSAQRSEETIAYYADLWRQHTGKIRYKSQQWDVVGYIQKNWVASLQLLPNKIDSYGYLSISEYPLVKPVVETQGQIQLPPDSKRTTDIRAVDGPHHSRTTVFTNRQSIANNLVFFRATYVRRGWTEDMTPDGDEAKVLLLRNASEQLTVTMEKNGDSTEGVAVLVEH